MRHLQHTFLRFAATVVLASGCARNVGTGGVFTAPDAAAAPSDGAQPAVDVVRPDVTGVPTPRVEYDSCVLGDTCARQSTCEPVGIVGATGRVCTYSCDPTQPDSCGGGAVCIGTSATLTTAGQCYQLCTNSGTCPGSSGNVCARIDLGLGGRQIAACIPGTTSGGNAMSVTTLTTYARCDSGNATTRCSPGDACLPSAVASEPGRTIGNTCTRACAQASECPSGVGFAACVNGRCAPSCDNPGSFDQRCALFAAACVAATTSTGSQVSFCVP